MKRKLFSELLLHLIILLISYLLLINEHLYIYVSMVSPILNPTLYIYISIVLFSYLLIDCFRKVAFYKMITIYMLFLLVTLFFRPINNNYMYNEIFYLNGWLKRLFQNKIIFLNIIGNIVLYIPLGYILLEKIKSKFKLGLISLVLIIVLEFIQFIIKVGVFDFIDILLNIIGVIIGMLVKGTRRNE